MAVGGKRVRNQKKTRDKSLQLPLGFHLLKTIKKIEIRKTGRQKGAVKVKGKKNMAKKKNYRC